MARRLEARVCRRCGRVFTVARRRRRRFCHACTLPSVLVAAPPPPAPGRAVYVPKRADTTHLWKSEPERYSGRHVNAAREEE